VFFAHTRAGRTPKNEETDKDNAKYDLLYDTL
jgi:hypothetical protein